MGGISRIAVFRQSDLPIEITETAIPESGEGDILVRILYTTLCRSDILTFTGKRAEKNPTIPGHDAVGIIHKIRSSEAEFPLNRINDAFQYAVAANPYRVGINISGKERSEE